MKSPTFRTLEAVVIGLLLPAVIVVPERIRLRGEIGKLEASLAESEKEQTRLGAVLDEVHRFEAGKKRLQTRIELVNEIARHRPCLIRVVGPMLPAGTERSIRIDRLEVKRGHVRFVGSAPSAGAVDRWIARIGRESSFKPDAPVACTADGHATRFDVAGTIPEFACNEDSERLRK